VLEKDFKVIMSKLAYLLVGIWGLVLGGSGCSWEQPQRENWCQQCGVYENKVVLGSSLALGGHAGYLGTQFLRGALAYFNEINGKGGVWKRKIEVIAYDDAYDPPKCLYNTQKLIVEDKVFSLFGYVGTPTTLKVLPFIEEARIPLVGMFTGANALREPFNPWLINIRPSYYEETSKAIEHMVKDLGLTKIAIFYQYDAYGFDGLTGTELALQHYQLTPVARGSYIRGTLEVEDAFERIFSQEVEAVVLVGTYEPCSKFIRLATAQGKSPLFYAVSFVGANELARRIGDLKQTVIMSQVVPPPEFFPSTKEGYTSLLKKYYPEDEPNFVGLEGYVTARVMVEGLRRAGPTPTRKSLIAGIESIKNLDLGQGLVLNFGHKDHQGLDKIYFTLLKDSKFRLINNWSELLPDVKKNK
jgi:ABC-type branched-subunit amino acid transport system substrate-binding protein